MPVSLAVAKLLEEYNRFSSTTLNELFDKDDKRVCCEDNIWRAKNCHRGIPFTY